MWEENEQAEGLEELPEEMDGIITMTTESGEEVQFLFLDLVEYEGAEYVVMAELVDGEPEQEVVILRAEPVGEDGVENYEGVEDEGVMQAVFAIFQQHMEEPVFELPEDAAVEEE